MPPHPSLAALRSNRIICNRAPIGVIGIIIGPTNNSDNSVLPNIYTPAGLNSRCIHILKYILSYRARCGSLRSFGEGQGGKQLHPTRRLRSLRLLPLLACLLRLRTTGACIICPGGFNLFSSFCLFLLFRRSSNTLFTFPSVQHRASGAAPQSSPCSAPPAPRC